MSNICAICREEFDDNNQIYYLPECNHAFHTECILHWFRYGRQSCPLCNNNGGGYTGVYTSRAVKLAYLRRFSLTKECNNFIKQQFKLLRRHERRERELKLLYKKKFYEFMGTSVEFKKLEKERDTKLWKINYRIRIQKQIICEIPIEMVIIVNRIDPTPVPHLSLPSPDQNHN